MEVYWDMLTKGAEKSDIVGAILEDYEIDRATVENDVDAFVATLKENNILE